MAGLRRAGQVRGDDAPARVQCASPAPWRGVLRVDERLSAATRSELVNALPTRPEEAELRRAVSAAVDSYLALRPRLAARRNMPLADEVAQQVLGVLRPGGEPWTERAP